MATLFEMNAELEHLFALAVDPETGEINEQALAAAEQLEIDRAEKIDGWCFYIKQKRAELKAMKEMLQAAEERYETQEKALNRTVECFTELMNGEKHKSAFNTVYYTTHKAVVLDEGKAVTDIDDEYLRYYEPTLDRTKLKAALNLGISVPGVHLEESTSMVIK